MKSHLHQWILVTVTLLGMLPVSAYDFQVDGIYYNINENRATVSVTNKTGETHSNSYSGDVEIPALVTYEGKAYSVAEIGEYAFQDCVELNSITIPSSVTNIGRASFSECTSLTSILLPNSVTSIEFGAFSGCTGLKSIIIPNSVMSIGSSTFYKCTGLTSVTIPSSVTKINDTTFEGCSSLASIMIPESVMKIGSAAFRNCTSLTSITLPKSIIRIEYDTFSGCTNLISVTIPKSTTFIGTTAFANCMGLTSVIIPNMVTNINIAAFRNCTNLTSITIGKSVAEIGIQAFWDCSRLESITIYAETPPNIWSNTFDNYDIPLYVPVGSKVKYQTSEYWSDFTDIQEIEIPQYKYTVALYSSDESMGSVIGGGEYDEGTVVTLVAIPASGYHFVQWSDGNTDNPRQITVTEDVSLSAEFSASCKLSVSSNDDTLGGVTAILTATPKTGSRFIRWSDGNTDNPRTVFVTETIDLIAEFEAISTDITEISGKSSHIYVVDRTLHVENNEGAYQVYTAAGQLVYTGRDTTVSLIEAGVYIVLTEDRAQKVVVK